MRLHFRGLPKNYRAGTSYALKILPPFRLEHHRCRRRALRVRILIITECYRIVDLAAGGVKLKSLRIMRIFRPLKTINALPGKKLKLMQKYRNEKADQHSNQLYTAICQRRSLLDIHLRDVCHPGTPPVQWRLLQRVSPHAGTN